MQLLPDFNYVPSETGLKFHESDAKYKLVVGPYGSGKTCMIMNDAKFYCLAQAPSPDGVRRVRIGVIRSTFGELIGATRKSILEVFPSAFGTVNESGSPVTGRYYFPVGDGSYDYIERGQPWQEGFGTFCQVEFALQALMTDDDVTKVRSANWTFAIINEASTVSFKVLSAITARVGRFPSASFGALPTYAGILMDTNQPPRGNWLLGRINTPPDDWCVISQPPAAFKHVDAGNNVTYTVNEHAENLQNLGAGQKPDDFMMWDKARQDKFLHDKGLEYYQNQLDLLLSEHREDEVDNLYCMLDVPLRNGKPVFGLFNMDRHVLSEEPTPIPYRAVVAGYDTSGIHPGCVFLQQQNDHWVVLNELYSEDMGMAEFLERLLLPLIAERYGTCDIIVACDPANAKDSYTGLSPSEHLSKHGFEVYMPKTNDPKTRIRAVDSLLNKNIGGLLFSPKLRNLLGAMQGGYHYRKLRVSGTTEDIYDVKPEKNSYSHVADALEYACLYIIREDPTQRRDLLPIVKKLGARRQILRRAM